MQLDFRVRCSWKGERFAALLPHIERALMEALLSIDEVIELMAEECVDVQVITHVS